MTDWLDTELSMVPTEKRNGKISSALSTDILVSQSSDDFSLSDKIILANLAKAIDGHPNWTIALYARIAVETILRHRCGKSIKVEAWDDTTSIEVIVDHGDRRLELLWESEGEHRVTVSQVTATSVHRDSPAKRPFNLTNQIRWLLGSDE